MWDREFLAADFYPLPLIHIAAMHRAGRAQPSRHDGHNATRNETNQAMTMAPNTIPSRLLMTSTNNISIAQESKMVVQPLRVAVNDSSILLMILQYHQSLQG